VAVRTHAGIFEVSHMGQIETAGPDAEAFLQRILSNDVTRIAEGGAQYSVLCNERGGVIDDLFTYRTADGTFLTVTNASNHAKDLAWFERHAQDHDVTVTDAASSWDMLALQGPHAREILAGVLDPGSEAPDRMRSRPARVAGVDCLLAGTGYTGEDGVEILLAAGDAPAVWDALVDAGAAPGGLGARDTLRLEVCFHLYGNDLSEDRDPISAGLGWACKRETGFIGADALPEDPSDRLVPFAFTGPGVPRQGNPVRTAEGEGVVTSGTMSPCLGIGIGMAYVPAAAASPGTAIEVDVRGKLRPAEVRKRPLYKHDKEA
jgi:aminomethyltransferase